MSRRGDISSAADGIVTLERAHYRAAAGVITDALLHDPGWLAVGPRAAQHRRLVALMYHRAALGVIHRFGRPIYGAFREGRLAGVAATFAAGRYPPPAWTVLAYAPAFVLAGPGPIVRGLRTSYVQDHGHPPEPHVFLWFLAVAPDHQRRGLGHQLLARVFAEAEAPVYLDTANPDNLPYYAGFGFEQLGSGALPRNARMWFMRRPDVGS